MKKESTNTKKYKTEQAPLKIRILLTAGVFLLVLGLALIFFKFPDNTYAKFTYDIVDGGIRITGYTGVAQKITIPSEIDGYTVKYIGSGSFGSHDSSLTKVTIPSSVIEICDNAFSDCENLTTVKLSGGLKKIGDSAFKNCKFLVSIELPQGLSEISASAFEGCLRLSKLYIPSSVEKIGPDAFMGCESLALNVKDSPVASEYAEEYSIPTSYAETGNFMFTLAIVLTVASVVAFIAVLFIIKKISEKRLIKKYAEESAKSETTDDNPDDNGDTQK